MWILTRDGFYSIVQKHGEDDLCIRARIEADLDRLRKRYLPSLTNAVETPDGDYRYRAWASHEAVAEALGKIARDLHYDNFKSEVARYDPERARLYGDVWSVLGRLQRGGPYGVTASSGAAADSLDESVADAIRHTARSLESRVRIQGPSAVTEKPAFHEAFRAGLVATGIEGVLSEEKTLRVAEWEAAVAGLKGRLGPVDVLIGRDAGYRAFFELKWAHGKNELGWTLWDIFKLVATKEQYGAEAAYAVVGAPIAYWEDDAVDCSALFTSGTWDSLGLFARYEKAWADLLKGGSARPHRVPASIRAQIVADELLDTDPPWAIKAINVDRSSSEWLPFAGDWPVGLLPNEMRIGE